MDDDAYPGDDLEPGDASASMEDEGLSDKINTSNDGTMKSYHRQRQRTTDKKAPLWTDM